MNYLGKRLCYSVKLRLQKDSFFEGYRGSNMDSLLGFSSIREYSFDLPMFPKEMLLLFWLRFIEDIIDYELFG